MSQRRRVVITGMGLVSPLGNDMASSWDGIVNGRSGLGPITTFDTEGYSTKIAGEIRGFEPTAFVPPKDVKKMDSFIHYGLAASLMAMDDSGLEVTEANAERIGAIIGAGIGGILGIEETAVKLHEGGPRKISPFYIPSTIINMLPGHLSIMKGLKGPGYSAVSACATSNHSIGIAMRSIQYGDADVMVAGGAERGSSPTSVGGFCAMKAMSTRNDEPQRASRPWDRDRDGFVMGDGAGLLVLEEYEHAKARGAKIYAELLGYGVTSDGADMVAPSGEGAVRCMQMAMAGVDRPIDYLNTHGTSTPLGDVTELEALRKVFGDAVPPLSSTKALSGHSLGAASVHEAIYCLLMMRDGFIAGSANIGELDPLVEGFPIVRESQDAQLNTVMSNSFGFGGTNAALVFGRV